MTIKKFHLVKKTFKLLELSEYAKVIFSQSPLFQENMLEKRTLKLCEANTQITLNYTPYPSPPPTNSGSKFRGLPISWLAG